MNVIKVWLLIGLVAVAILGVLWATEALTTDRVLEAGRMALSAIIILALAHYVWSVVRGHSSGPDKTDKPVP